jgi:hypothetical protein
VTAHEVTGTFILFKRYLIQVILNKSESSEECGSFISEVHKIVDGKVAVYEGGVRKSVDVIVSATERSVCKILAVKMPAIM